MNIPLAILDWVGITIILFSGLVGCLRGFFAEILSLLNLVIAFFLAKSFFVDVEPLLAPYVGNNELLKDMLVYGAIFVAALILLSLLSAAICHFLKAFIPASSDRISGIGFGLLRGVLLLCVMMYVVLYLIGAKLSENIYWKESQIIEILSPIVHYFASELAFMIDQIHHTF